jgi:hypothetical protein
MAKVKKFLAIVAALAICATTLVASSLSGVTLPDTTQVGGKSLVLNGMGLRTKFFFKIYVAGFYLQKKSSDPDSIIKSDVPKRIVLQFVQGISKAQVAESFKEAFDNNAPDAASEQQADIARLLGVVESVKTGDQMALTYLPGTGTTFSINGRDKLTIPSPAFRLAVFSIWFGPKPPNADLKKGLLGK